MTGIIWHQRDLRIEENPAVLEAVRDNTHLLPVYIHNPKESLGEASLWWLHKSLEKLKGTYEEKGCQLLIRTGDPLDILKELIEKTGAKNIYWNIRFEPNILAIQQKVKTFLKEQNIQCKLYNSNHLINPKSIEVSSGHPYRVFTPFSKACIKEIEIPEHSPSPKKIQGVKNLRSDSFFEEEHWMKKLDPYWEPGRKGAIKLLNTFVSKAVETYQHDRDFPMKEGTSKLSPHLHFGEISPFEAWTAAKKSPTFQKQLLWREFGTYFIYHFPDSVKNNWNPKFDKFKWDNDPDQLEKWKRGQTGYPIIDAAMRQLWETGWMHNRLRMIVASFLIKDLFIHWIEGEKWFWDTLVDADKGNNTLGWQWVAGSGPDAAPYFRIFNPILQSKKFDPEGDFIRKWIPEIATLETKWIHTPWEAPEDILRGAGITLGKTYPLPIVDHADARKEAQKRYEKTK